MADFSTFVTFCFLLELFNLNAETSVKVCALVELAALLDFAQL